MALSPNRTRQDVSNAGLLADLTDADSHPKLDVSERLLWAMLMLLAFASVLTVEAGRPSRPAPAAQAPAGLIEAESLKVVAKSREFTWWLQPTSSFPAGTWSKDGHMFAFGTERGDWIDLALPAAPAGEYQLALYFTKASDYAVVSVSVNGQSSGEPIDLWSGTGVETMEPVELPTLSLEGDGDVLRIQASDANPAASPPFYQFGLDGIRLSRTETSP